jgi:hypothetical protein
MRNFRIIALSILFLSLAGCSSIDQADLTKAKSGFITDIDQQRILVNDTYFSAVQDVEVVSDSGKQMKFSNLEIGVKVEPWFSGEIRESYPAQADVEKIVVIKEKNDKQMQEAVKAIVEHAEAKYGKPVVFQEIITKDEYFQATIAGMTIENPNPISIRYDFMTKQVKDTGAK